jgi:HPt (histidine-containing phosphotransfer) domain-containing protein
MLMVEQAGPTRYLIETKVTAWNWMWLRSWMKTSASSSLRVRRISRSWNLISGVFRTIHTIKGTCAFFGFDCLGSVAHIAENILCQVRESTGL